MSLYSKLSCICNIQMRGDCAQEYLPCMLEYACYVTLCPKKFGISFYKKNIFIEKDRKDKVPLMVNDQCLLVYLITCFRQKVLTNPILFDDLLTSVKNPANPCDDHVFCHNLTRFKVRALKYEFMTDYMHIKIQHLANARDNKVGRIMFDSVSRGIDVKSLSKHLMDYCNMNVDHCLLVTSNNGSISSPGSNLIKFNDAMVSFANTQLCFSLAACTINIDRELVYARRDDTKTIKCKVISMSDMNDNYALYVGFVMVYGSNSFANLYTSLVNKELTYSCEEVLDNYKDATLTVQRKSYLYIRSSKNYSDTFREYVIISNDLPHVFMCELRKQMRSDMTAICMVKSVNGSSYHVMLTENGKHVKYYN